MERCQERSAGKPFSPQNQRELQHRFTRDCNSLQLVEKARLRRSFPTGHVSPALSARPGKRAGKPCYARLPNPPRMSLGSDFIRRGRREACALWALARSAKRPGGVNRNERRARPASAATIEVADLWPSEPPIRFFDSLKGVAAPLYAGLQLPFLSLPESMRNYSASAATALAAVRPETKISTMALPPRRLPPWMPPVTSPAA